jgi:PAS domain S-box-containing protein
LLDAFDESDVMVMETLASQIAVATENARLMEGLEALVAARTAEIIAEKEKSETILRHVDDAIAMSDPEMRLRYVNPAFTSLTGYTAQEAIGQHVSFMFRETMSEQDRQSLRLALAQGDVWRGEVFSQRKDGRTYEATLTIASMRDAEGRLTGYVSSHQDISRRKRLERARSQFMTNVSHELRTPVANMKLYANLLQMGRKPEKVQYYAQVIEGQADRLAELIQDILEMTELDSGQAVMAWKPVSLPTVIADTVTRYQSRAEASGLALVAKPVPPDLPVVRGDQARLAQALGELVENAVIFTPSGGQVTVETGTTEAEGRRWVTVAVHDTGPGISPEEQERVFDRFFRGSLAESGHLPGTGLGLSIAQEIVHAHGGLVTVESKIGEGSTFTLWLPSVPHQADRAPGVRG